MLKIGVTGGIGSGKSVVSKIFSVLGIPVYDADKMAKNLMASDQSLIAGIIENFGKESYLQDGSINTQYLSKVFSQESKLKTLNSLVHPRVGKDFLNWTEKHSNSPYIIKEAALLFESGSYQLLDKVITVYSPLNIRIKRVTERDAFRSLEQIYQIVSRQLPEDDKIMKAHYVIHNDENHFLIDQVLSLHTEFLIKKE